MKKPWVIGVLSIIPGLGFIILGEIGKGVIAFVLTLLPFMAIWTPWETIAITGVTIGIILWCVQIYYAVLLARSRLREEAGEGLPVRKVFLPPLSPEATKGEKALHNAKQIVLQHIQADENLRVALHGIQGMQPIGKTLLNIGVALAGGHPNIESTNQVYLGATNNDFILIQTDPLGKPASLERFPLHQVALVKYTEGTLNDEMIIDIGQGEALRFGVGTAMRQGTRELERILSQKEINELHSNAGVQGALVKKSGQPVTSSSNKQDYRSKHPALYSAVLGGVGGVIGAFITPMIWIGLILLLEALGGEDLLTSIFGGLGISPIYYSEDLIVVLLLYCVCMVPIGGMILGAIPGAVVGWISISHARKPKRMPAILAGFAVTFLFTFIFTAIMLAS